MTTIGDNISKAPPSEIIGEEVDRALALLTARRDALITDVSNRKVTDNDEIGRAADVNALIGALVAEAREKCVAIALPHTQASQTAKAKLERFIANLERADIDLKARIAACRQKQRSIARQQQDEQRAREAELRGVQQTELAPAQPVSLPSVRGDYGSSVSDRAVKEFSYTDPTKLPIEVLNHRAVKKAIQQALRDYSKLHDTIPGVHVGDDLATTIRKPT